MRLFALLLSTLLCTVPAAAEESVNQLDSRSRALKQEVLELNRELFKLEEELLYPASTQVALFVALDVGTFFQLDSVRLELDGKEVANHLYTERQLEALKRGGVQRIYTANLRAGKHEVNAFFTGKGPRGRDYKRAATFSLDKGLGPQFVKLTIDDKQGKLQPEFVIRQW